MRTCRLLSSFLLVLAACVLSGCASVPPGRTDGQTAEIKVYTIGELLNSSYESVGHVWVDSWRTAFWPPTYPSEEEALSSLRAEAARLGANGIVNVVCLDQNVPRKSANAAPAILCYANAIRVPPSAG